MALRGDSIENRLEELKQDERRMMFDSQLRAFRRDDRGQPLQGRRVSRQDRKPEGEYPADQLVALLEGLSKLIEGLEKRDRALADEIRQRARKDQHRRRVVLATELTGLAIFVTCWAMGWV